MGLTIAEKLFSRKNKFKQPVTAGDIVEAKLDGVMCHYSFFGVTQWAIKAGFPDGLPRVFDKDKVFVLIDHHQPALSQQLADRAVVMRRQVERLGVRNFHDSA